jgi:hypothetical protein
MPRRCHGRERAAARQAGRIPRTVPQHPLNRTAGQRISKWADAINYTGRARLAEGSMFCLFLQLGRAIGNLLLNRLSLLRLCGLGLSLF